VNASRWLQLAMWAVLAAYVVLLLSPPDGMPPWVRDVAVGNLAYALPMALMFRVARDRPETVPWAVPLAVGSSFLLCGHLSGTLMTATTGATPFPSVADVAYPLFYPFLLAGVLTALRRQLRGVRLIVALDGIAGCGAGAAVASWALATLVAKVWNGSLVAAITLAYPLCDAVLIAASLGALAVVGLRNGRQFILWALGMMAFGVADIAYAYRLTFGTYHVGTPLEALWALGLAVVALGATTAPRSETADVPGARSLAVVTVASVSAVVVLAAAPGWELHPAPSLLSLITLAACGTRFVLAFVQLRELAAIREQALTDELTGCANRRALYLALDDLFRPGVEDPSYWAKGNSFALALIDLDHFKEVNDSHGHAAGDDLLKAVVARFSEALKELQTPHLLARLGGDEFAVILYDAGSRNAAMACGAALQESLVEPVALDDVVLHAQASIGIATAPLHGQDRGDILFAADAAMYEAKTSGEMVSFHSPAATGDRRKRLEVAEDLFAALERDELTVDYQPIVTVNGRLVGAEALVRWDHPTRGRLLPGDFLEAAERYRLTPAIAERVLDLALADLARWRAMGTALTTSVNVSASDLREERLVKIVASALLKRQVPPEALTIEITETAMMTDPELARSVMQALHDLGVRLSVDDYGTGYSSLEYLLKLPINEIKLDRAFSVDLPEELRATAIVRSTVDLTHALGLRMVAEGVEDEETLLILRELSCDLVQGWHLGRPMSAAAFERLLPVRLSFEDRTSAISGP
jgi:diguanylate cyclase (GGDEF)-like protein